jgi:sugar/nucleoside kinase (ribokinase family)
MTPIDMVIIGHVSKDIITIDRRERRETGGAVYFASFAAKPSGVRILVITKVAIRDYALLDDFWAHGIPVLPIACSRTTAMMDSFSEEDGYERTSRIITRAQPFKLRDIPVLNAGVYYLGALMFGEIPETLIEALAGRGKVAIDVQGVLRVCKGKLLVMRDWKHKKRFLPHIHFLKADLDEARLLTGHKSIEDISSRIHEWGVKELLVTEDGGVTVSDGSSRHFLPFHEYKIEARSGRGDTCFASYLSYRLNHSIEEAMHFCQEITNSKLRAPGPYRG